ncbi:aldolase/citrate lyase family protein [Actinomycetospora lemnae]|uniref:Aldolase/citrate lyase family protein n=1 Tax=Actinomycetospora lemnae TaxID=3019891 RepID=A0ABT5SWT4_9PSEU|nr:aldolase/citrate lyase family protein [Actinomycetospora sp. DW7H6]MDD7967219.1 aldolase/citrate lyase family protein [Actinomycetospora sp. DW7H6]
MDGLFVATPSPALVEMVGAAGYDVAILDAEHALVSPDTLQEMIRAAEVAGIAPWVRVPEHDPGFVLRVLDAGATGLVIPHVRCRADVEEVVRAARYAPAGMRSLNSGRMVGYGGVDLATHVATANAKVTVVAMIEDAEALDVVDEIVTTPGLDMVLEGAADLSQSLGVPWRTRHPRVRRAVEQVHAACVRHGVRFCAIPRVPADVHRWRARGVHDLVHGEERSLAVRAFRAHVSGLSTDSSEVRSHEDVIAAAIEGPDPVCLYSYDLRALQDHVRAVVDALPPRCRMFYAVKANSDERVVAALDGIVAGFEVASGGELRVVGDAAPDAAVLLGGPVPTDDELAAGVAAGVTRVHVESLLGLHRLSAAATAAGTTTDVLLRVNLAGPFPAATIAMAGRPTQFGIDESDLADAVAAATTLPGIRLAGFHLHSLSNNLDPATHLAMLGHYRDVVLGWEERFGVRAEVVDVGGGIGVDYAALDSPFDWPAFCAGLAELLTTFPEHWREIDFECGRFLVARCGVYAAEVLDVKHTHGHAYALLRGGTHHFRLPASWQHSHPFHVVPVDDWPAGRPRPEVAGEEVTVCGELCTPKDTLARAPVERLRAGDVVVFEAAGAYGWDISHHDFLRHPHPQRVFLSGPPG